MSQNAELQKVKERIRTFSARTVERGCTEAEMDVAMAKIGELLEQYNLNMGEIDLRDEQCIQVVIDTGGKARPPVGKTILGIAKFCGIIVWSSRGTTLKYHLFGMESDIEMAQYLYRLIDTAMTTELEAFKKTSDWINAYPRKSASVSFSLGMGSRIFRRLNEMAAANELNATIRAQDQQKLIGSNVTSLVIIKDRIVEDAMKTKNGWIPKAKRGTGRATNNSAYGAGGEAGGRVNLSRPLTSSGNGGQRLIGSN